jgi:hypothetical protein
MDQLVINRAIAAYAKDRTAELTPYIGDVARVAGTVVPEGSWAKDAQQGMAFFISQLAHTEAKTFTRQYKPMQYRSFVPVSTEAGEWAEQIRYETYDSAGMGRRASSGSSDINTVDVTTGEKIFDVAPGDIGYQYSQQEILQSAYYRRPLSNARMVAAMEGYERHMNQVALFGEIGLNGLYKHPSIPFGNAANGGWAAQTPDKILADLNNGLNAVFNSSSNNDAPDTILLPLAQFSLINSTARSANSDTTILEYFLGNNLSKAMGVTLKVMPAYGLETAGTGGTSRALFYTNSPDRLIMHTPMPLRFLAPQPVGLMIKVPGMYRYSGVEVRYTKSAFYMEGI